MIAVYERVSTDDQSTDGQDHAMREYAESKGYEFKEYVDEGISGKTMNRPAIQRLIADCRSGKIRKILVFELSRISRDMGDQFLFMTTIKNLGIGIETPKGPVKFDTGMEKVMVTLQAYTAQTERENTSIRTKAALAAALAKGETKDGRPLTRLGAPVGNSRRTGKFKSYDPVLVGKLLKLETAGMSHREIADIVSSSEKKISGRQVSRILLRVRAA